MHVIRVIGLSVPAIWTGLGIYAIISPFEYAKSLLPVVPQTQDVRTLCIGLGVRDLTVGLSLFAFDHFVRQGVVTELNRE
jgi:hypothetical protein